MSQLAVIKSAVALITIGCTLFSALPICRYTVRDIGFVDLRGQEYVLTIRGRVEAETVQRIRAQLSETNVKLADETAGDVSAIEMTLTDAGGRSLKLARPESNDATESDEDVALQMVRGNLFSETLRELEAHANDSFAQLLFIEGSDAEANANARTIVDEAQAAIRRIEPLLPRPLALPLRTQRVSGGQRATEQALIWSLGLDASLATGEQTPPIVAIVYGRGRLAGQPLVGDQIELREALAQLALVGESCECETDRAWLQERVLPFEWTARARKAAAEALGFDPESPLVKAEVVSIVSRGPSSRPAENSRTGDGRDDIEQLLLGYDETLVAPASSAGNGAIAPAEIDADAAGVKVALATGSGWDFEEPTKLTDNTNTNGNDNAAPSSASQSDVTNAAAPVASDAIDSLSKGGQSPATASSPASGSSEVADEPSERSPWMPATLTVGLLGGIILIVIFVLLWGPRN